MDPNATLAEIRTLTALQESGAPIDTDRLAELITALDAWLSGGGFLPTPWQH